MKKTDNWQLHLDQTWVMPQPADIPAGYNAYNPSGIVIETDENGTEHHIVFLRVEPDTTDHIGKSSAIAYKIDPKDLTATPKRYHNIQLPGEDPAIKRIRTANGLKWLISTVTVRSAPGLPDNVDFETTFWLADKLTNLNDPNLQPIATGPSRMKDVRVSHISPDPQDQRLLVLGRPQLSPNHGTISAIIIDNLDQLNAETVKSAQIISSELFPQDINLNLGKLKKGAANDAILTTDNHFLILGHQAWATGAPDYKGRHYETVAYRYSHTTNDIIPVITLATRNDFESATTKTDDLDLNDVVFPGGFCYNEAGQATPFNVTDQHDQHYATFGLSDGGWAIGSVICRRGLLS